MPTQLKHEKRFSKDAHLAIIVSPDSPEKVTDLSEQEAAYLAGQLQNKSKLITINQYTRRIYVVVAPDKKTEISNQEALRDAGHQLQKLLKQDKVEELYVTDTTGAKGALFLAEGIVLSNYEFLTYKSDKTASNSLKTVVVADDNVNEQEVSELNNLLQAVYITRDLVNTPHNYQSAEQLSESIAALGSEAGFNTETLDLIKIQSLKMGGLLAVNQGSENPPTFNIMEWKPENAGNQKPYILVGKGVVYDTGGLSLKPTPNSMDLMKSDMAGAAAVIGVMHALASNKIPLHVIALVPATDNRPGGNAYAPGDVITMYSGKTVEVLNTDAEGRLILADALCFAQKYNPELVIDVATLTGAAARAVGREGLVMMGNAPEAIKSELKTAGERVYERLVELPLWEEYAKHIESDVADIKNIGGAEAGAISAGKFLEYFTDYNWMHLDIAGTAFLVAPDSYRGKHATGSGVRLLYNFLTAKQQ